MCDVGALRCSRFLITGLVQGVGFRPFLYKLASELGLTGSVSNSAAGVTVEVVGTREQLATFPAELTRRAPALARIDSIVAEHEAPLQGERPRVFRIEPPQEDARSGASVRLPLLPDLPPCADCRAELASPLERRFEYPFLSCTNCGPRYTIVESLPYDRPRTTMARFPMCRDCRSEYQHVSDRRHHAQPIACPACGPKLILSAPDGRELSRSGAALEAAAQALAEGKIVAMKGVGGYQLLVDATRQDAVTRLRERKRRPAKPLAVLFRDLAAVRAHCRPTPEEEAALASLAVPIVLVTRAAAGEDRIAEAVAPALPRIGAFLPASPLHLMLTRIHPAPLVATSGNASDEPMAISDTDARARLREVADLFLWHDRPIRRRADDSVAQVAAGAFRLLRRARGYVPLALSLPRPVAPLLAAGGHQKAAVAMACGTDVLMSPHLGDLSTPEAVDVWGRTVDELIELCGVQPRAVAVDLHPDYESTRAASRLGLPIVPVQHHAAHVASVMAEHGLTGRVLGVAWDGTGLGPDGTIWGGEFLLGDGARFERVASLTPFCLPGGEKAVREPRRSLLGLLEFSRPQVRALFTEAELELLRAAMRAGLQSPVTSSAGRLFDAAAAALGICAASVSYEGQAACELEAAALLKAGQAGALPFALEAGKLDFRPAVEALLKRERPIDELAAAFHETLAAGIEAVARQVGAGAVALSGGCFQNRLLLELAVERLRRAGFETYWNRLVPPNDGGLAYGQAAVVAYQEG